MTKAPEIGAEEQVLKTVKNCENLSRFGNYQRVASISTNSLAEIAEISYKPIQYSCIMLQLRIYLFS